MPDSIILLPILLLPLGAIAIAVVNPRISKAALRWLTLTLILLEIAVLFASLASSSHRIEISQWALASFSLAIQLDSTAFVLLLVLLVSLVALQLTEPDTPLDVFSLFVLSSSVLVICAGNLITAFFAWAFLDFALFAWREAQGISHEAAIRALVLGQLAALALFAGTILIGAKQNETGAILVALAFWARLGLFPFHWIFPSADLRSLQIMTIRGASLMAGASLWLHWDEVGARAPSNLYLWLAGVALIAAGIWVVREGEAEEKIAASTSVAALTVPLAIGFARDLSVGAGSSAAFALGLWSALGIAFALAMFELGIRWQSDYQSRLPRLCFVAGILSLAGLPLTPAFLGRVGVYVVLAGNSQWILLLVAAFVQTLALVPLWLIGFSLRGSAQREPARGEYAGMQLLGIVFIIIGLAPMAVIEAMGQAANDSANQALNTVIRTNDIIGVASGFTFLLAPVVMSFLIARVPWGYHHQLDQAAQFAARVIDLDWLARLIAELGQGMSAAAGKLSALAEENPTVWILLVGLWVAIFILTSR